MSWSSATPRDGRSGHTKQLRSLRVKLHDTNTDYVVVKNKLLAIALTESGRVVPDQLLKGTNGVAFLGEDIGKSTAAINDWIKSAKVLAKWDKLSWAFISTDKFVEELYTGLKGAPKP